MGYTGAARRGGTGKPRPRVLRRLGFVRRSQLVTTYGVGSLIAIDNESFIVAGLDSWDVSEAPEIHERRLAQLLGVDSFRLPPAPEEDKARDGARVRRFPEFYSCPSCRVLQTYREFNTAGTKAVCGDCDELLVPSRFVLACDGGHIEEFPYRKWVHRGKGPNSGVCRGSLKLQAAGSSASLRSVVVECGCGETASMEGAFRRKTLRDLGIRCSGRSPWLQNGEQASCDRPPRTMQRGSSSVWNPVMSSALSIPPFSEGVHALVDREKLADASDETIGWFCRSNRAKLRQAGVMPEDVFRVVAELRTARAREQEEVEVVSPASLRAQEYRSLVTGSRERLDDRLQSFVCEPPEGSLDPLGHFAVADVMLVKRLREVRALAAFTRGTPPEEDGAEARHAPLSSAALGWLPAIEVVGEGVFLRLDEEKIRRWENGQDVRDRVSVIRENHLDVLRERAALDPQKSVHDVTSPITPRRVLLHTLAHVLIDEWSLDGGYPASSLRERIYAGPEMSGILIYTATSDSAGSLGGLVAQGEPERLARTLASGLSRACWCSNDPLCMDSKSSGVDGVNLAACHACVLLPETSCENNNCFLDRGLLVGDSSGADLAFFPEMV
ncbi:DUF1998 domain-containing protein [Amycolatopsis nalaikhensis]|uniref:DUF1998 domain-containing protein n=1 Tax=Amycolatopsis nalaikhensis TaxID=715472 RepID=A0ABY8XXZ3_9PSEU|nr:DUF1998 domain-containing protein [Amycolatopsis sp. 2-2]WIV60609.1 DUF1998 domain-containing protein [Amycolatopsis sp. 2-2]